MTHSSRLRRAPRLLALAVALLGVSGSAIASSDLRQRLNVRQEASEVVIGETMYNFYLGDSFAALNQMLLAKAMGRVDESITSAELLLGDLLTAFGMPDEADNVFARLATRDLRTQTRNETMFRQGRLQYRQGNYFEAERILNVPLDTRMSPLETQRRVMLANVLMTRNAFLEARDVLAPIPLDNPLGPYATYNIGVSHLRANHAPEGMQLLEKVMNLPVSDTETNALKDRAALALGYDYLQMQQPDKARDALVNVRLKGPFSNNAMLALGWANYERKDYRRALAYWLELLNRSSADRFVQEAMLLAPRAYEALQANQQALYGYKLAASTLTTQLGVLDRIESDIDKPDWLDSLSATAAIDRFKDPLAVPETLVPNDPVALAQLYTLFVSHPFNEGYQQYEQLKRLRALLDERGNDLRAMREVGALLQRRQATLPALAERVKATRQRLDLVAERYPILDKRARQEARNPVAAPSGTSLKTMEQQFKLQQLDTALARQPNSPAVAELRQRVAVLKGLILMDNASKVAPSQDEVYADLARSEAQLRVLQRRMEALQRLLAENQERAAARTDSRVNDLESRLGTNRQAVDAALEEYRAYLSQLARNEIEDRRTRLNSDIGEAHLSIARLQDASLQRDDRPATSAAKPMP